MRVKNFGLGLLALFLAGSARAAQTDLEVAYTTFSVVGVACSSGTVIQLNASRPAGFKANVAGYRLRNQDGADSVWIGGVNLSTTTAASIGELLKSEESVVWPIYKDYLQASVPLTPLYCKAADAAGAAGALISVVWFGY